MFESSGQPNLRRRQQQPHSQTENTRQQRPGERKPNGTSSGRRTRDSPNHQRQQQTRQKLFLLLASVSGMGIWYLTPASDLVSTLLLSQIPVEADVLLGKAALLEFPYRTTYDPEWTPLVQEVGKELVATLLLSKGDILQQTSQNMGMSVSSIDSMTNHFDFGIVKAPIVNAFALPGGIIRVTDQLLKALTPTRGELAALLGHEIGHALHRHSQKRIIQQKMLQLVVSALTYEDDDDDEENFGEAMGELLVKSAHWFGQQKFSRNDEYQADLTSWQLLVESKTYNPQSVQSLLTKLWTLDGQTLASIDWMSTHPATESRIETLNDKWLQLSRREKLRLEYRPI